MKTRLSNWREETDLLEAITGKMTDKEALKKVSEKKGIQNKVIINPKLSEAVKEMGGELLEIAEIDKEGDKEDPKQAQIASKQKRAQMIKKQVLMKKLMAVRAGSEDIVAHYEPDGDVVEEEVGISSSAAMEKARKEAELKAKEEEAVKKAKKVKEDYETKKRGEVLSALERDKRPLSKKQKEKIASDIVKKKGDTSKSDDRYAYEEFEAAVEYFYEQGINEEGIDLIIEEVGLEEFVDFVDDSAELLTEERAARKMNVRTLKATQKKAEEIKASKKDVVKRGTPADTLARARAERSLKKPKLAKPAPKKEAPAPTKAKKTAAVVKSARKATVAKARKDFDGDGKVETPKQEHRGVRNKKITKAVAKAKPAQPKKPASKEGLRAKIKSAYEAGVKRHRKATQPVRVFHKGMKAGAKKTVKFAKDVKKAVVGEEYVDEAKVDSGKSADEKATARNLRNTPPGADKDTDLKTFITRKPGESLEKARQRVRQRKHAARRGMKEDRALDIVRQRIIKKHGEGAIYDPQRDKPTEADKKKAAAERKKRDADKAKAFADRAKKAGYKNPQDYANVVARYGSEDNMKKGRGLGT